jgi:hypothetical protein
VRALGLGLMRPSRAWQGFFADVLEIPEEKPANLAKRGGCWFERDALRVDLGVEHEFRPAKKGHPAYCDRSVRSNSALEKKPGSRL